MEHALHPLLLVKRPRDFVLFLYLALVTTFLQADTRLVCQLLSVLRPAPTILVISIVVVVACASLAVVTTTFLPRYVLRRQAVAAAILHFAAFALSSGVGAWMRLRVAPAPDCKTVVLWPPDTTQVLTIALLIVVAASVFTTVLNLVIPSKTDYSDLQQRVLAYYQELRKGRRASLAAIRELLQKALDTAEKARLADPSARYRHALSSGVSEPLSHLLQAAKTASDDHSEEYLKLTGHRDPGLSPPNMVATVSRAQRDLERIWPPPRP